jgi:hypothetical protein
MGIPRKKICPWCGERKYKREFYKTTKSPDGYDYACKECRKTHRRKYYRKKPDGLTYIKGRVMVHEGYSHTIYWSDDTKKKFQRLFPYTKNEDLAIEFDCSARTISRKARQMGLEKDPKWLHKVWDANRKLTYHNPNQDLTNFLEAGKKYQFKKGIGSGHTKEQRSEIMKKVWAKKRRRKKTI